MNVMILGAGRIGRGFIAELMTLNGEDITFFDASQAMADKLNEKKEYTIHVLGNEDMNVEMHNVKANFFYDGEMLADCWAKSDFIFTACGGKNMANVGETLAKAFKVMVKNNTVHTANIVTCENWIDPAKDLKDNIVKNLTPEEVELFEKYIGVSESVIMCTGTGAPDPSKVTNEMDTWVQNLRYLPIDFDRIKGEVPNWQYIEFVRDFGDLLKQKIYTNNTSVATVSYLGKLKGLTYVADSSNDPEIEPILDQVYEEINGALIKGMGIDEASQLKFSKTAKAKYTDRAIVDLVDRIARDPIRKLGPEDRFIGPMSIALQAGVTPKAIALGAAAALYFDNPEDEDAKKLKLMRESKGVDYVLENISKIDPNGDVALLIKEAIEELKAKGWIKE
ncbi:mannitol dehydrogenase family protein [Amedibacillus sp. YH-ame10]